MAPSSQELGPPENPERFKGRLPRIVRRLSPLGDGSYALHLLHNLVLDLAFVALLAVVASDRHG